MQDKVLVIAAHPDDEVLGCGGTISKHILKGDLVKVLIAAEGITSRVNENDQKNKLKALKQSAIEANKILGVNDVSFESLPDNRLDKLLKLEVIQIIEKYLSIFDPNIIYTHHCGDVNIDHQILHEAVVTACRPLPGRKVEKILFFEVPSSTEWQTPFSKIPFVPNWFVNIEKTLDQKLKSLEKYDFEMRKWPHPRSLEGVKTLALWRGSTAGMKSAEAFILGRNIENK